MSFILFEFAKSFLAERLSAEIFSEAYIELWKIERDKNLLQKDEPYLGECLSSIFCAADMYNADDKSRKDYEFDNERLRLEVSKLIEIYCHRIR